MDFQTEQNIGIVHLGVSPSTSDIDKVVRFAKNSQLLGVLLDLEGIRTIGSQAIGIIVGMYKELKECGVPMGLLHLHSDLEHLIRLTQLHHLMPLFQDQATGVAEMQQD